MKIYLQICSLLTLLVLVTSALPINFSWANRDGVNYMGVNINQNYPHRCESGWAFATTNTLNARIRFAMNKTGFKSPFVTISPQVLLECDQLDSGCLGGEPAQALRWIKANNITDSSCNSYKAQGYTNGLNCTSKSKCQICGQSGKCKFQTNSKIYAIGNYLAISGEVDMQQQIFTYGPIMCGMAMTEGLKTDYSKGIYNDTTGAKKFNHYVTVYGWGETDGLKYWNIMNSFGPAWGEEGNMRLIRGKNNMGIETLCYWADLQSTWLTDTRNRTLGMTDLETKNQDINAEEPIELPTYLSATRSMYSSSECNASWAFAVTQTISDKLYKLSKGTIVKEFSVQALLNCGVGTCVKGDPFQALTFIQRFGFPEEGCQPYQGLEPLKQNCSAINNCGNCQGSSIFKVNCTQFKNYKRWKISNFTSVTGVASIKNAVDIQPVICGIHMSTAFSEYTGGVFYETTVNPKIDHYVEVVGHHADQYWIGREFFGTAWGISGFFKIKMGSNVLGIETKCYLAGNLI